MVRESTRLPLPAALGGILLLLVPAVWARSNVAGTLSLGLGEKARLDDVWGTSLTTPSPHALGLELDSAQTRSGSDGSDTPPALTFSAQPELPTPLPSLAGFPHRVLLDLGSLAVRPLHFDNVDWTRLALGTAAVSVAWAWDNHIRDSVQEDGSTASQGLARQVRPLGTWGGLAIAGGLFVGGRLASDPGVATTGEDGMEAILISAGVITPLLKATIGRARPNAGAGHASNDPFTGGQSFPSGEAAEAFALASVVSAHTESLGFRALTWSLAGVVAWERIRLDSHWASDVVAGGLIGTAVGDWVVVHHRGDRSARNHVVVTPLVGPRQVGLEASLSW